MNPNDNDPREDGVRGNHDASVPTSSELPDALRIGLRALRTDDAPATDLWPGIAARLMRTAPDAGAIDTMSAPAMPDADDDAEIRNRVVARQRTSSRGTPPTHPRTRRPSRRAWTLPVAIAASVAVALAIGWQLQRPTADGAPDPAAPLIAHEATAMTREYRAAFAAIDTRPLPATEARTIAQLDRTAADVRAALKQAPESRLLLTQLKRVYARRLDLSQRFAQMG